MKTAAPRPLPKTPVAPNAHNSHGVHASDRLADLSNLATQSPSSARLSALQLRAEHAPLVQRIKNQKMFLKGNAVQLKTKDNIAAGWKSKGLNKTQSFNNDHLGDPSDPIAATKKHRARGSFSFVNSVLDQSNFATDVAAVTNWPLSGGAYKPVVSLSSMTTRASGSSIAATAVQKSTTLAKKDIKVEQFEIASAAPGNVASEFQTAKAQLLSNSSYSALSTEMAEVQSLTGSKNKTKRSKKRIPIDSTIKDLFLQLLQQEIAKANENSELNWINQNFSKIGGTDITDDTTYDEVTSISASNQNFRIFISEDSGEVFHLEDA